MPLLGVSSARLRLVRYAHSITLRPTYRRFIVQPVSMAIALAGLYWTVQGAFL